MAGGADAFLDTDRAIATSIVDAVDDTGYLTVTLDEFLKASAMTIELERSKPS